MFSMHKSMHKSGRYRARDVKWSENGPFGAIETRVFFTLLLLAPVWPVAMTDAFFCPDFETLVRLHVINCCLPS